jgi:hypothetical protein
MKALLIVISYVWLIIPVDVFALTSTTLEATEDATVDSTNPTTNYGTSLRVQAEEDETESYLKYDISNISGTVRNAYVELTRDAAGDDDVFTSIHRVPATWDESIITWDDDRPASTGEITRRYHKKSKTVRFDVTRYVQDELAATEDDISMVVKMETATSNSRFYSSEYSVSGDRPTLVVETSNTAGETSWQCTRQMGFSQTTNWYLLDRAVAPNDDPFEDSADITSTDWAYSRTHLCGVTEWWDPTETACYATWDNIMSDSDGCTNRENAPDRLIIQVSGNWRNTLPWVWAAEIRKTIDTAREELVGGTPTTNYNPEKIYLIPVIGGPDDEECECPVGSSGCIVRAAENHPDIESAINIVAGSEGYEDVYDAEDFEVSDCALYSDNTGHIYEENAGDQAEIRDTAIDLLKDID